MSAKYQQFNLIEEVTRNDGSKYYEISNINQNGIAEMAADNGKIKEVRILKLNIARTKQLQIYEKYINETYDLQTLLLESDWRNPKWIEWEKSDGKIKDAYLAILKANKVG